MSTPSDGAAHDSPVHDPGNATNVHAQLPDQARRALVAILTNRYLTRSRHRAAWDGLIAFKTEVQARLNEMFLDLIVDQEGEVAFKRQQEGEDIPRLLRRERALTRDASFLLIFLRRECAYADPEDGPVVVSREQIGEFLRAFREDGDADNARFKRRVDAAINALTKPLQLLTPDPAADYLYTVSPVVVPLVGVDELQRLQAAFQDAADAAAATSGCSMIDGSSHGDADNEPTSTDSESDL